MKVLIIGYGSIGRRHEEVLLAFKSISQIDIVTKQALINKVTFKNLEEVEKLDKYDYFIIASETYKHYVQLKYIELKVSGKIIFCEKPLFEKKKELLINKNKVFIGYVLRFHPLLKTLKEKIENQKVLNINVLAGQYLPFWRPGTNYKESYSAKKSEGGGVLLDLSHEIDYIQWLVGEIKEIMSFQTKVSDLEIDSDDLTTFISKTKTDTIINLSIDYISKASLRRININTLDNSYELDFIKGYLIKKDKQEKEEVFNVNDLEQNYMFEEMHKDILFSRKYSCTYEEALNVMNIINIIQEQNK